MRKRIFCLFTIISTCCSLGHANIPYGLSDLEILEKEKNTKEFLDHARDIKPRSRDKHYQEMVENMAISHVKNLIEKKSYTQADFVYIETITEWPTLKNDAFFQSKRNDYMQIFFTKCFSSTSKMTFLSCEEKLFSYWNNSNKDPDLGLHFATILSERKGHLLKYWNFIHAATQSKVSEYLCKKDVVIQFSKIKILGLDQEFSNDDTNFLRSIDKNLNIDCLTQLYPDLLTDFKENNIENKSALFRLLRLQKKLTPSDINVYFMEVFLSGPPPSKELNLAWNSLTKLGQNFDARQQVLLKFSEKNLLPGRIFKSGLNKKSDTILNLLFQNFPEYIDLYSKTCLSYMAGEKVFPYGNPTPHCQNLFKTHSKLLDKGHINRFQEVVLQ